MITTIKIIIITIICMKGIMRKRDKGELGLSSSGCCGYHWRHVLPGREWYVEGFRSLDRLIDFKREE